MIGNKLCRSCVSRLLKPYDHWKRFIFVDMEKQWIARAIDLATANVKAGGGPFGAVIVKRDTLIATGVNRVTDNCDPTAHAEVMAIREAGRQLNTHDLQGCVLYASCEPCPMCLGAILWARLDAVYFAATREEARAAGFDDAHFYEEVNRLPADRELTCLHLPTGQENDPFTAWQTAADKIRY